MKVTTESGTVYYFHNQMVRRVGKTDLRRDGVWLRMQGTPNPQVGLPMMLALEPLTSEAKVTVRFSTPVVSVEYN